jgi:uncharacterized protein YbjT (DUF2867 family)
MQRVLVAGATGYLGGFVVKELANRGCAVRALVRSAVREEKIREFADEIVEGEVTKPETIAGICDGIDVVFSSIGITRQKDGLTFKDVDYQGNRNLLDEALRAGVRKFVYVSVFNGPALRHLDIVDAHEAFVDLLATSGMGFSVLRPTGYFSDMGELVKMATGGRVWLIGPGTNHVNPIHGSDLAVACVDTIEGSATEIDVGGPETMSWNDAAQLAFTAVDRPVRISHVPAWLMWSVVRVVRIFNRHQGELLAFFTTMSTTDAVAPTFGRRRLVDHFADCREESR